MPKNEVTFAKKCKIFERWGLRRQTPVPPAAGSFAPKPPVSGDLKTAPHSEILATRLFCALYLQKNTYRCRVVINSIVTEVFNCNIYTHYLSTNRGTLVVYIAQTVYVLHHCKYIAICSIDVIVDDFDRFDLFFFLRLTICQVLNFVFLHRHENSYLLFQSCFNLILFLVLVFQLTIILFGV